MKSAEELIIYQLEFICHLNEHSCLAPVIYFIVSSHCFSWSNKLNWYSGNPMLQCCTMSIFVPDFCSSEIVSTCLWSSYFGVEHCLLNLCRDFRIAQDIFLFQSTYSVWLSFHQKSYGQWEGYIRCFKYNEVQNAKYFLCYSFENLLGIHLVLTTWNVQGQISMKRSYNLFQKTKHLNRGKTNNMHWVKECSFYGAGIASTCSKYVQVHSSQQSWDNRWQCLRTTGTGNSHASK